MGWKPAALISLRPSCPAISSGIPRAKGQLRKAARSLGGQRALRGSVLQERQKGLGHQHTDLLLVEGLQLDLRNAVGKGGHGQVYGPVQQAGVELVVGGLQQIDLDIGIDRLKGGDDPGHDDPPPGIGDAHPQQTPLVGGDVAELVLQGLILLLKLQGVSQENLTGIGQLQGGAAEKELTVQFPLQRGDVGAQGLLRDVQLIGGPGEVALIRYRRKVLH